MQAFHRFLGLLSLGLQLALFVGMLRRGKARQCWTFLIYIGVAAGFGVFVLSFPSRYSPSVYMVKQGIYDGLLFGMALELSVKVFSAFRGVASRIRVLLAVAVIVSTSLVAYLTPVQIAYEDLSRYQPGITTGGIWCLSFVGLLIVWYQIPVPDFTRVIVLTYVPLLVVFVVCADLLSRLGWGVIQHLNLANAVAYVLAAGYWVFSAWRKD